MAARTNATRAAATTTSAGVLRPEDLARLTRLARYPVAEALASHVENLWSLRWDLPPGVEHRSSTLPHPACT